MLRMMIAAAALLVPSAASASKISLSEDGSKATISYRDLNLGSPAGRSKMTVRIHRAAEFVCFDPFNYDPVAPAPVRTECYRAAVRSGVDQMNAIAGHAG